MVILIDAVKRHYGRFLGMPSALLTVDPQAPYRIVEFRDVPCEGAVTLATLGLSDVPLHMFRQEFLFLCYEQFMSDDLIKLLAVVAEGVRESNHPLLHGAVLPPAGPLLEYTKMEALYVGTLMYFGTDEESFNVLKLDNLSVLFSWLFPIYPSEVEWIRDHGYDAFESMIVERDPDLMDLERPPMV